MIGDITEGRFDGCKLTMYNQLSSCSSKEIRPMKVGEVKNIVKRYDVNLLVFYELDFKSGTV